MNTVFAGCGSDSSDVPPTEDGGLDGESSSSGASGTSGATSSGATSSGATSSGATSSGATSSGATSSGATSSGATSSGSTSSGGTSSGSTSSGGTCLPADAPCTVGTECCTKACIGSKCSTAQCKADSPAEACAANEECCSGKCDIGGTGKCVAIGGGSCRVEGNPCTANDECCSKQCDSSKHCNNRSYCTQTGDSCASDTECCGGSCAKIGGAALGRCAVVGGAPCNPAGTLCTGVGCNNDCCSLSCGPLGTTGMNVCQPPSGCKPQNELCATSSDCCGGPGNPTGRVNGSENGYNPPKTCTVASGQTYGRCDFLQCLRPGDVCKNTKFACGGTSNNCCEGDLPNGDKPAPSLCNSNPDACCSQDALGIPRCRAVNFVCTPGMVVPAGQKCATSADCCGNPCVNNQCAAACVAKGQACTVDADCCSPEPCVLPVGSSTGVCGGTSSTSSSSSSSSTGGTSSSSSSSSGGTCALYGQTCVGSGDCCGGVPCTAGRCRYP